MLISKKELFKRKNRNTIYNMYEDSVNTIASLTERFNGKLKTIRELKHQYRNSEHIYNMLSKMESNMDCSFYNCPFYKGQLIKSSNYIVDVDAYSSIPELILRLMGAIGEMNSLIDTINYLEQNELGVRSI